MSIRSFLLLLSLCSGYGMYTYAQEVRTDSIPLPADSLKLIQPVLKDSSNVGINKAKPSFERQLRFGVDLYRPIASIAYSSRYGLELMADYTFKEDKYAVLEAGYGGGKIDYEYLSYKTQNAFVKLGVDVSMFDRLDNKDWDIIFVGIRYGTGIGQRGPARFVVNNPFGGPATDETAAKNFWAHWGEITAGMRFELLPRFFAGWNVRAKFFINSGTFSGSVAPNYISGYGQGDKSTSFDFNFYCAYAIRWHQ